MAVVVVPGALVLVMGVVGNEALEGCAEVMLDQARLEFHGGEGDGRADDEEVDQAGNAVVGETFLQVRGDVDHVIVPFGGEFEREALHAGGVANFQVEFK